MPNLNYKAGRRLEWGRRKHWMKRGWVVVRSSGSHGAWDLCGVRLEDPTHPVMFIQCKVLADKNKAKSLLQKFKAHPPMPASPHWTMTLEIQVKGCSEILSVTV